jgi:hypothetical protein
MRKAAMVSIITILITVTGHAQTRTSSVPFSTPDRGGVVVETLGDSFVITAGYARVQPSLSTTPTGAAIFALRQNGVLVAEAAVPGMNTMVSGRTYAEVNGPINTGLAIVNPNSSAVQIGFSFTDQNGNDFGQNSFTIDGNTQIARFLDQEPFAASSFAGSFSFNASAPVAVIAIRSMVNERGEFLMTTQPVIGMPINISASPFVLAHFADGGGWKTQVILVNTTDVSLTGTVQFFSEGTATVAGSPLNLTVNGQTGTVFNYIVRARSSAKLETAGIVAVPTQVGSVKITPLTGGSAPSAFVVFAYAPTGVTVSQATVQSQPEGTGLRTYVETNSTTTDPGTIQSGFAIANSSATSTTVNFELTALNGTSLGLAGSVSVPANGHVSRFLHEVFPGLPLGFRGILRMTSNSPVSVVSLRTRYNERRDFLITTIPVSNEATPSNTLELFFPHIVDGSGYNTQFILFSGAAGQVTTGTLRFFAQTGQALILNVR